jgi:hypothetical protein
MWYLENLHFPCRWISAAGNVTKLSTEPYHLFYRAVFTSPTATSIRWISGPNDPWVYTFTTFLSVLKSACKVFFSVLVFHIQLVTSDPSDKWQVKHLPLHTAGSLSTSPPLIWTIVWFMLMGSLFKIQLDEDKTFKYNLHSFNRVYTA